MGATWESSGTSKGGLLYKADQLGVEERALIPRGH